MATYAPPKRATAYIIYVGLESVATAGTFQSNPTLAAGDFKVSIDGGSLTNLTTLPTVTPAGGKMVKISLSSSEMTGDNITVVCSDAAGSEWKDLFINLATVTNQNDDLATPANVETVVATTARSEPSGVPAANATLAEKISWIFTLMRNKQTQTATTTTLRNDADNATIATSTVSDDGTTGTSGKWS
jgi:hypothetical protein